MMNYLDALIDRHLKAEPRITSRLPSIFEPESSHGGWDVVAHESSPEREEAVPAAPFVPAKKNGREHAEATDFEPSPIPIQPAAAPVAVAPRQKNAGPGPVGPTAEEKPFVKRILHEPSSSLSAKAAALDVGFSKSSGDTSIAPVIGGVHHKRKAENKDYMSPHREATQGDRAFFHEPREENDRESEKADPKKPGIPLSNPEKGVYARPNVASTVDRIAPLAVQVRHVHPRNERVAPGVPHPEVKEHDRPLLKSEPGEPGVTSSRQERVEMQELHSARERNIPDRSTRDEGLLKPSAVWITPLPPTVAGPERSKSQPEPVINVTIGRIEVRATVPPQKQAPGTGKRPPVMGLDEYLRRRSGGHDR